MKTRIFIIIILLLILGVLLTRNDERITDTLLNVVNPIKQNYKALTRDLEDKGHSYLFQKESIEKLSKENRILRKRLLAQTHYIRQVKDIYKVLPRLSKLPYRNIALTSTISYVKLNTFSQIILTKPKGLKKKKLYGLMQDSVVAGIAKLKHNQLYGYLTSDPMCRFAVFVGDEQAPGIAMGLKKNLMIVKFIPKWHKIKVGDPVETSGLDNIFFQGLPVGIVTRVETQSAYKVAYIKTYADIYHPNVFFLITENTSAVSENIPMPDHNETTHNVPDISSIPSRIDQTQEEVVEPEIPAEVPPVEAKPKPVTKKIKRKKEVYRSLDLF